MLAKLLKMIVQTFFVRDNKHFVCVCVVSIIVSIREKGSHRFWWIYAARQSRQRNFSGTGQPVQKTDLKYVQQ